MKLCFAPVVAITLWATVAQAQLLPSGPGSSIPVGPDDGPLLNRPANSHATGLGAGSPGPFLPNPNDPTRVPVLDTSPFAAE
jgi:hypothetical protein